MDSGIRVLHVDDNPDLCSVVAQYLERKRDRMAVSTATTIAAGLDHLQTEPVDCIVSDYDLIEGTGLEFLESVREDHPDLPFILYTGKGSEEVASEAISAGVTDYLQKESGTEQYDVLANRIENAVDRYRAENRFRQEHDRFLALFENFPEPTLGYVYRGEEPVIQSVNDAFEEVFGYDEEGAIGTPVDDLIVPPDKQDEAKRIDEQVRQGQHVDAELRRETATGPGYFRFRNITLPESNDLDGFGVYTDLTERVEREQGLQESQAKYRQLVEQDLVGIYIIKDREFEYVNPKVADMIGLPREEIEGRSPFEWIHPDDHEMVREKLAMREEGAAESLRFTLRAQRSDGSSAVFEVEGGRVRIDGELAILGTIRDITEFGRMDDTVDTLHDWAARLQTCTTGDEIYESVIDAAVDILDYEWSIVGTPRDGDFEIVAASESAPVSVGDRPLEADEGQVGAVSQSGEPMLVDDMQADEVSAPVDSSLRAAISVPVGDYGVFQAVDDTTGAFDEEDVKIATILCRHAAEALQRIDREATLSERERELADQNERLEQFVSVVSHDLRNPLNVAQERVAHLLETIDEGEEHLESVQGAHDRMESLIEDLLVLARQGDAVGETETIDLSSLANAAWDTVETGDATLETDVDREVVADPERLRALLENLFRNAVEHGRPTDRTVSDESDTADNWPTVRVDGAPSGFAVEDDGPGIPPEERHQIFETGYTTSDDGTGFGLSIVEQIATAHGWEIRVTESDLGGARFEISGVK